MKPILARYVDWVERVGPALLAGFVVILTAMLVVVAVTLAVSLRTESAISRELAEAHQSTLITGKSTHHNSELLERNDQELAQQNELLRKILAYLEHPAS